MDQVERWTDGEWWQLLIRGVLAILVGIIALTNTTEVVMVLLIWLALYAIVDGGLKVYTGVFKRRKAASLWPDLLSGLGSILVGIIIFAWPELTAVVLIALIAIRAILQGISDTLNAFRLRHDSKGIWLVLYILGGIAELIFGVWLILQPQIGGLTILAVIGIYAVVVGTILIFRSLEVLSGGAGGSEASA